MGPDLTLNTDHLELQSRARDLFLRARTAYHFLHAGHRQRAAAEEVWSALRQLRFHGLLVPQEFGGTGQGLLRAAIVMEELAAQGLHSFRPILQSMAAVAVARFGSQELKARVLPRLANGDCKVAIASTEAEAGFNVLDITTQAVQHEDWYVINGSKHYISGADSADSLIVVARTRSREECERLGLPRSAGISLFHVDAREEGISMSRLPTRGEPVLSQYAVSLHDVRVPARHRVGDGAEAMFAMFNPERILVSAMASGIARYCLEIACDRARTRRVFEETPIGTYQSVQHPLASVAIGLRSVQLLTWQAASLFDQGREGQMLAEAANAAKYLSTELVQRAVDAAIDTYGGKAFDEQYDVIHLLEAARLLKTSPISNALILNQVAERTLGLPRSY